MWLEMDISRKITISDSNPVAESRRTFVSLD